MDFVKKLRKLEVKPTDSFIVHLTTNEPERIRDYMHEIRKAMPEGWRGTIIGLGPNEKLDALPLPAVRELTHRFHALLEQENAVEVMPGQVWESLDKRDQKSLIEILQVASANVLVKHTNTGNKTTVKRESFKSSGKRGAAYKMVRNAW